MAASKPIPSRLDISGVGFAFEVGQTFTSGGSTFKVAEVRGDLRVLEHTDTLERRVESEEKLAALYARGQLFAGTGEAPSPLDSNAPSWSPYSASIAPLILDASKAAQRSFNLFVTLIAHLRNSGYTCLRPTATLEFEYKRLISCVLRGTETIQNGKSAEIELALKSPEISSALHLWTLIKNTEPGVKVTEVWWPTLSTIYNWSLRLDKAGGNVRAILPNFQERGGRGQRRLLEVVKHSVNCAVEDVRRDKNLKITPAELEKQVKSRLIAARGLDFSQCRTPSRSTCSRIVHSEFSEYEIVLRNKGPEVASTLWRSWYPRDRVARALEVVEFDDKDSRVFLIDEESNLPYGRGHVTSGIDQYSEMPLGFSISEQPRSTWSALSCLVDVMLPADMERSQYDLVKTMQLPWGKPGIAVFDNATYNHVADISITCRECVTIPAWSTPYTPTEKAIVESFNGRMDTGYFSTLGGYGGPKKSRDGLNEGLVSAVEDVRQFRQGLIKWTYGVFANEPTGEGLSRWQRWHESMRLVTRRYPVDIYRLRLAPTLRHTVKLRPEGLRFTGLFYQSDHLKKLQKNVGFNAFVLFRYNPGDMSRIYAFDPDSRVYFEVPSSSPEYTAGLTLYQHRLIRKMARIRGKRNPSIADMLREREELRKIVSQNKRSKKLRERRKARRVGEPGTIAGAGTSTPASVAIVTGLEDKILDISEIGMEEEDEGWEVPELA